MTDIGTQFRALHQPGNPFVLANAWDVGSARLLAGMGAQALATSSAAYAFTLGVPDGGITRDQALAHAQDVVAATPLPVSGDFEDGFGADPDTVAETVRLAAAVGLAGISVEDNPAYPGAPYDRTLATERIRAAAAAARALPRDFVLVARADGVMNGHYDMNEALARIRAFDEAGADCLYVPVPPSFDDLARVCAATKKPVNALVAGAMTQHSKDDFARIGVARLSLGSALARATHRTMMDAMSAMIDGGDFTALGKSVSGDKVDAILKRFM